MAGHPLRPATRQRLGGPSPRQQADRTRPHPMPQKHFPHPHAKVRSIRHYHPFPGAIPVHGAGWSRITHPFATLTSQAKPGRIPFDLHVLSTPPAFILSQNRTLHKKTFMESQQTALKKKKDGPSLKERTVTQKPRHPSNPLGYHTGGHRTGNQRPPHNQQRPCDEVVQYTLLSSQTTTHGRRTPPDPVQKLTNRQQDE